MLYRIRWGNRNGIEMLALGNGGTYDRAQWLFVLESGSRSRRSVA